MLDASKRAVQDRQRQWLREIMKRTGDKPSVIATRSEVSDTTLTRLLNKRNYSHTLSTAIIEKIKRTYGVPGPNEYAGRGRAAMIGFHEAEPLELELAGAITGAVHALLARNPARSAWLLKSEALNAVGYLPGDVLIVDTGVAAAPQDVVLVELGDLVGGRSVTMFRVCDPPYLVAGSHNRTAYKPVLADGDRTRVRGVVLHCLRPDRLSSGHGS